MYLERLEIKGFKSFAEKSVLLFSKGDKTKGITVIVGPNGSGKSNVADSIRWVLGEQSLKMLRSKKTEDVIFAGTNQKSPLGFAEVSLFFNNEDRAIPLDYSEVVITRRLYRKGDSEFYINKNKVRLSDVLLLIAQANFGQKSYSVIGQGMIEGILNASPTERKEFFTEAAGVKQYQIKKDQSLNKLKQSQENISQVQIMLTEIEPKLKFLSKQIKRLEQREETQRELTDLQGRYYNFKYFELKSKDQNFKKTFQEQQQIVDQLKEELAQIKDKFSRLESNSNNSEANNYQILQREYNQLRQNLDKLTSQKAVISGRLQASLEAKGKVDLVWLNRHQEELAEKEKDLLDQYKVNVNLIKDDQAGLVIITQDLNLIEQKISSLQGKLKEIQKESNQDLSNDFLYQQLSEVLQRQKEIWSKISANQLDGLESEIKKVEQILAGLLSKIKRPNNQTNQNEDYILIQNELSDLLKDKQEILTRKQELNFNIRIKEEQQRSLNNQLNQLKNEISKVQKELSYFSSQSSQEKDLNLEQLNKEKTEIENQIARLQVDIDAKNQELSAIYQQEKARTQDLLVLQKNITYKQNELDTALNKINHLNIEYAKFDVYKDELIKNIIQVYRLEFENEDQAAKSFDDLAGLCNFQIKDDTDFNPDFAQREINRLTIKLEQIGTVDQESLDEYNRTKERFDFLTNQSQDLLDTIATLKDTIKELDEIIKQRFDVSIAQINENFSRYFKILFNGGFAKLSVIKQEVIKEVVEEIDQSEIAQTSQDNEQESDNEAAEIREELIAGVDIQATPPGKRLKNISFLSGGEKALTAIALICAIIANNPSPFVVLDEVDAALDEFNSHRFANIIDELSSKTQFIIISHNRITMHKANLMYGVTSEAGVSQLLSLNIDNLEQTLTDFKIGGIK